MPRSNRRAISERDVLVEDLVVIVEKVVIDVSPEIIAHGIPHRTRMRCQRATGCPSADGT